MFSIMLVFFGGPGPKFSLEGVNLPDEIYLVSYSGSLPKLHLDYVLRHIQVSSV